MKCDRSEQTRENSQVNPNSTLLVESPERWKQKKRKDDRLWMAIQSDQYPITRIIIKMSL
jgi:hypothetical protein